MRKLIVLLAALGLLATPAALAHGTFPEKIPLPNAFAPEGIEIAHADTFFVGSLTTGAIYSGSLRTGAGQVIIPGAAPGARSAAGIEYDRGRLWVAGAAGGTARVYDVKTRALLREYQLTPPPATFINDVVATRDAAYFTDSQQPSIFRIAIGKDGAPGDLTAIPLKGDYQHVPGQFNLNGIVATANGKALISVSTVGKKLYLIDPASGVAKTIDIGTYDLANGDGLLLQGLTLYVVQNSSNQVAVFRLSKDLTKATFIKALTDPDFDVPTTIDRAGKRLYVVNARFGTATPTDQHYDIVKVG